MSDGTTVMPFGKYRGKTIEEIPSSYLRWISNDCKTASDDLIEEADNELSFRDNHRTHFEED